MSKLEYQTQLQKDNILRTVERLHLVLQPTIIEICELILYFCASTGDDFSPTLNFRPDSYRDYERKKV